MKNILVVEDNRNYNYLLKHSLQKRGYSVSCVFNGKQAAKALKSNSRVIDIIILDLMMPEMDGREFLEFLNEQDLGYKPSVCILSAKIDKSILKGIENVSIIGYFVKGDHLDDLIYKIEFSKILNEPVKSVATVYTLGEILTKFQVVRHEDDLVFIKADRELATNSIIQITIEDKEHFLHVESVRPDGVSTLLQCKKIRNLGEVA